MRYIISFLAFSAFSSSLMARDHVAVGTGGTLQVNDADGTFMSNSNQYPRSLQGLRTYLDTELTNRNSNYAALNEKLSGLERQSNFASTVALVPIGLGVGSLLVGGILRSDEEPTDAREKEIHERGGRLMLYGLGGIVGGFLLGEILEPKDSDIMGFVDFHNEKSGGSASSRKNPISLNFLSGDKLVTLQYRF